MREILFRGKDIRGNWHIGLLAHIGNAWYISNSAGVPTAFEVIPDTIGQFTGLTDDKNEVKIFESDIVRVLTWFDNPKKFNLPEIAEVAVCYGGFGLKWGDSLRERFTHFCDIGAVSYEKVGNIYDNPELLKGGAEQCLNT